LTPSKNHEVRISEMRFLKAAPEQNNKILFEDHERELSPIAIDWNV